MWADITVPYWVLILTAALVVVLGLALAWMTSRYYVLDSRYYVLDEVSHEEIERLKNPNPKHYFWVGHHKAGEMFFRINDLPRSRCHFVSGRGGPRFAGHKESDIVILWGHGSDMAEFDPVRDKIAHHYPDAAQWWIP